MSKPIRALALLVAAGLLACAAAWAQTAETATPIHFARGASRAVISGGVERGGRALYTLGARAGQTLAVRAAALERNVAFQIYRPGFVLPAQRGDEIQGKTLQGAGEGQDTRHWSGRLPDSGDYLLVVGATRGGAAYRLRISIR
ncbi:MAG TPA: hypothetical protein VKF83_03790 [Stellaceae bacterium]|nr:hypothetical protein [Stellaceae bacterium]